MIVNATNKKCGFLRSCQVNKLHNIACNPACLMKVFSWHEYWIYIRVYNLKFEGYDTASPRMYDLNSDRTLGNFSTFPRFTMKLLLTYSETRTTHTEFLIGYEGESEIHIFNNDPYQILQIHCINNNQAYKLMNTSIHNTTQVWNLRSRTYLSA